MRWIQILKKHAAGFLRAPARPAAGLIHACEILASPRGAASATAIANDALSGYGALSDDQKRLFLASLAERFGPDKRRLDQAIDAYRQLGDARSSAELHAASEPRLQQVIRRLNVGTNGTASLVRMRQDALKFAGDIPNFHTLDSDFVHVFSSWFNTGFLSLRRIAWTSPGNILRKVIDYEAVHPIKDWDDLRRRIEPQDRLCYAFFHPQMPDEPLIFVEVALTAGVPDAIETVLSETRAVLPAAAANTAVFYSISNCQAGLRGVPFGNTLIKRAIETLGRERPGLKTFVTLSPVPGLAAWMAAARTAEASLITPGECEVLKALDQPEWHLNHQLHAGLKEVMSSVTARYITQARSKSGGVIDPVARFHLGNGARLEHVRFLADIKPGGLRTGLGMMVNYLYDLNYLERNLEVFEHGQAPASGAMNRLARPATAFRQKRRLENDTLSAGG